MIEDPELRRLFQAESDEHLANLDRGLLQLEKTPADRTLLEELFRESHSLKGAARMLGLGRVETTAHVLEGMLNAARRGEALLTPAAVEPMNAALTELRRRVQEVLDGGVPAATVLPAPTFPAAPEPEEHAPPAAASPVSGAPFRIETVRVETRKLDELLTQVGELSVIQGRTQHRRALLDELLEGWTALERRRASVRQAPGTPDAEAARRFGAQLKQARDALTDDGARLESTLGLIEDQVRGIRLLPLATLFGLFPRMVRDLARAQDKEVELVLEGGDITVDKRILEEMKDPLMHLLRNAIDHGVELPAERARLDKPPCATLRLAAWRDDAGVLIEVRDDGGGLDAAAVRREAVKRGLLDADDAAGMTPLQLQQLIFTSGFSTSRYVTELSGRGVGLDVVRVNVERLKGGIRLESIPGQGLAVQMRLPLSLATTRLLLARVAGRLYGLPVEYVHTSRRVRPEAIFTLEGRPAVLLDGEPVIVARLADLLELPRAPGPGAGAPAAAAVDVLACVVLQVGDGPAGRLGLLADELPAEEEVVPKPLGAPLRRVRNVAALAMLGSGEVCAVLNAADLLRSARKHVALRRGDGQGGGVTPAAHPARVRPAVLLAEDSALIRAMEKRILEDARYEVVTAVDGIDALNLLGSRSFAAVVTDIMMPNMDGLALTARIRAEPRHRDLPVILVTSLASDADKRRGLDAGANAYIPKPSFDQRVLLDTLQRLIAP